MISVGPYTYQVILWVLLMLLLMITTKVDIGKMNNRYFINLAAGGQLTQVSYETPSRLKSIVGPFAYYIKGFEMLPQMKAVDLRIEYDNQVFQGEALLFLLGLTNSMAGFEKLVQMLS